MKKHLKILAIAALAFVRCGHTDANFFSKISRPHRAETEEAQWNYAPRAEMKRIPQKAKASQTKRLQSHQHSDKQNLRNEHFDALNSAHLFVPKASTNL